MAGGINININNSILGTIMNILRELLEISRFDLLCENFGNLKQIDKKLLKALMRQEYGGQNSQGKSFYTDLLAKHAGQNSEVRDVELKNSKTVTKEFEENPATIGAVIYDSVSGKQFGIVGVKEEKTYKSERKIGLVINFVAISGDNPRPDDIKHHRSIAWDEIKASSEYEKTYLSAECEYKDSRVAKLVNLIRNRAALWKTNGKEVALFVKFIYADKKRPEMRKERVARRTGIIPVNLAGKELENFKNSAISSLRGRLDSYKRDKLKNTGDSIDLNSFAKEVKKSGFLDKFLVNGFVFNYHDDRINVTAMRKGIHKPDAAGNSDASYIQYRIDDSSPEYNTVRNKYWDERQKLSSDFKDDKDAWRAEHEKLKKRLKLPPSRIKILLDFEGGAIVPYDVELDYSGI